MENARFFCSKCCKGFKYFSDMRRHEKIHPTKRKPGYHYQCQHCKKDFQYTKSFFKHVDCHEGKKTRPAKYKKKKQRSSHAEALHFDPMEKHHKENTKLGYKCTMCFQEFSFKCNLQAHILTDHFDQNVTSFQSFKNGEAEYCKGTWNHLKNHIELEEREKRKLYVMKDVEIRLERLDTRTLKKLGPLECETAEAQDAKLEKSPTEKGCRMSVIEQFLQEIEVEYPSLDEYDPYSTPMVDSFEHSVSLASTLELLVHENKPCIVSEKEAIDERTGNLIIKEAILKEQLGKLSAFLEQSGCTFVGLKEYLVNLIQHKQLSLDKQPMNVWVFSCRQEVTKEPDLILHVNSIFGNSQEKEISWKVVPDYVESNPVPSFITPIIQVFEDFFEKILKLSAKEDVNLDDDSIKMVMQTNSKNDIVVCVVLQEKNNSMKHELKQQLAFQATSSWNVKSVYYKHGNSDPQLLYGTGEIYETIRNLRVSISPKNILFSNPSNVDMLAELIDEFLQLSSKTTLLEIGFGCEKGLVGMLLAPICKATIGVGLSSELGMARQTCEENNILNASFVEDTVRNIERLFEEELNDCDNIAAIVNHSSDCALSKITMRYLRGLKSLNQLVVITMLTEDSFPAFLTLMEPLNEVVSTAFFPLCLRVIDINPDHKNAYCIIQMVRENLVFLEN